MVSYKISTIDSRPHTHKSRIIKNVVELELTPLIYIFHTNKGRRIRLRRDTWRYPIKI